MAHGNVHSTLAEFMQSHSLSPSFYCQFHFECKFCGPEHNSRRRSNYWTSFSSRFFSFFSLHSDDTQILQTHTFSSRTNNHSRIPLTVKHTHTARPPYAFSKRRIENNQKIKFQEFPIAGPHMQIFCCLCFVAVKWRDFLYPLINQLPV